MWKNRGAQINNFMKTKATSKTKKSNGKIDMHVLAKFKIHH
jgi:hypothetical protein